MIDVKEFVRAFEEADLGRYDADSGERVFRSHTFTWINFRTGKEEPRTQEGDLWETLEWGSKTNIVVEGVEGEWSFADGYTGSEGGGENTWRVIRVGEQLFMQSGYYASFEGTTWDGEWVEVEPYEKTVMDYRPVGGGE